MRYYSRKKSWLSFSMYGQTESGLSLSSAFIVPTIFALAMFRGRVREECRPNSNFSLSCLQVIHHTVPVNHFHPQIKSWTLHYQAGPKQRAIRRGQRHFEFLLGLAERFRRVYALVARKIPQVTVRNAPCSDLSPLAPYEYCC